ncbi:hypothetical protein [Enterococcus sp. N249-2]
MKKKNRRRLILIILAITFSAMPLLRKMLVVLPCLMNLVIDFDDFNYKLTYGGLNK